MAFSVKQFESRPGAELPNLYPSRFAYSLTLSLPITTKVPYANSLDPDETQSNSASHPDPSSLTLRQYFL